MTQDEIFDRVKVAAINLGPYLPYSVLEKTAPVAAAISLAAGVITRGKIPRTHENLMHGARAIARQRGQNENTIVLAWKITANQVRNGLLFMQTITTNHHPAKPLDLSLPPQTQELISYHKPFMVLSFHCLGDLSAMPHINEVLAGSNGVLIAAAPQPGPISDKLAEKAKQHGLTVADTKDKTAFLRSCIKTVKKGGVIFLHGDSNANQSEPKIPANFLGEEVRFRENIFRLAKLLKIPIVPAISTIENGKIKVTARRPIETEGREPKDIAQDWADSMTELTKQYPTSNFAFFELELKDARR